MISKSKKKIIAHYRALLNQHVEGSKVLQYRDKESHYSRFKILSEIDKNLGSVLDFGCGIGDLCSYLRSQNFDGKYHGIDIVPEFIDLASAKFTNDQDSSFSIALENWVPTGFDYAFVNGVFNNVMEDNEAFLKSTIKKLWDITNKGISFNILSNHVEYFDEELYYASPQEVFAFLKTELKANVVMRNDYILREGGFPFEVTFYAKKQPILVK